MDPQFASAAALCLCVVARAAGFCVAGTWPLFPGICLRVRTGIMVALASAAMPAALLAPGAMERAAGIPPTTASAATSRVTTALAPMTALSPILTPGRMATPRPIQTPRPIRTALASWPRSRRAAVPWRR